jgi:hypothetical protein
MPNCQLGDQLRLVEAIPLALGAEVGQPVQGQSRFRSLPRLPLDRLYRAPAAARAAAMPVVSGFTVLRPYGNAISYGPDCCARSIMIDPLSIRERLSSLDDVDHLRHFELHGEANTTRLRGISSGR